jgi:hypothetical protein
MKIKFYRNTSAVRFAHSTLPAPGRKKIHGFWMGPLFVSVFPSERSYTSEDLQVLLAIILVTALGIAAGAWWAQAMHAAFGGAK